MPNEEGWPINPARMRELNDEEEIAKLVGAVSLSEIARMARMGKVLRQRLEGLCLLWERAHPGEVAIIRCLLEETK